MRSWMESAAHGEQTSIPECEPIPQPYLRQRADDRAGDVMYLRICTLSISI